MIQVVVLAIFLFITALVIQEESADEIGERDGWGLPELAASGRARVVDEARGRRRLRGALDELLDLALRPASRATEPDGDDHAVDAERARRGPALPGRLGPRRADRGLAKWLHERSLRQLSAARAAHPRSRANVDGPTPRDLAAAVVDVARSAAGALATSADLAPYGACRARVLPHQVGPATPWPPHHDRGRASPIVAGAVEQSRPSAPRPMLDPGRWAGTGSRWGWFRYRQSRDQIRGAGAVHAAGRARCRATPQ